MYSSQSASVKLLVDLSFFDWTAGSAREFGFSLFSGVLSVGTLLFAVCRTPMELWVTEVFNLKNSCRLECLLCSGESFWAHKFNCKYMKN